MSKTIEDIVDVQIAFGDRPITRSNVSTPLILAADAPFGGTDRVRTYTDPDDMITDGFVATDGAYLIAQNIFSGNFPPREVIIGNVDVTGLETYVEALAAITAITVDWFFLLADTHLEADILALAAYAEAERIIYVTSSDDANIPTSATTDIMSQLQTLQYDHTILWPHVDSDTDYVEGGIVGAMAGLIPGSSTLHGKTIPGVAVNTWTSTEASFVESKNGFSYYMIGGVGFAIDGKMASGRFFDIVRGGLNLEFKVEEALFGLLKRQSDLGRKVPYTLSGFMMIENTIYDQLQLRVGEGFLSGDPAPRVIMPNIEDVDINDKAARELNTVQFEGVLAGAVHYMQPVRGYLVLDPSLFS